MNDWAEIRRLRGEGVSISEIARLTGAARNTVKAALASTAPPRYQRPSKGSVVDAVEPRIRELLREYPRMPATVIAERVGWVRGLTVFKERVAQLRPVYLPPDPASRTTYLPGEVSPHGPAEHARVATLIRLHNHALSEQATEPRTPSDPGIMPYAATSSQVTTIRAILNNMNILPVGKPRKSYADQDVQATRGLTSPNRTGLTSRLTSEDGSASTRNVVRPSLEVLRERRGRDARPDNLVEDVRACIQPVAETCCLSPTCHEVVSWPKTGGRPSRFCSRACQERFDRERGRLLAEVSVIEAALPLASAPAERRYLANQLSRRTWLLERYPLPYKEQDRLLTLERETRK